MSAPTDRHAALHASFRWQVPAQFNIAEACCGRWARETPDAPAVIFEDEGGCTATYSYGQLQRAAHPLSHALVRRGVQPGDRVARRSPPGMAPAQPP